MTPQQLPYPKKTPQARHALAQEFAAPEPHKWGRWRPKRRREGFGDLGVVGIASENTRISWDIDGTYTENISSAIHGY